MNRILVLLFALVQFCEVSAQLPPYKPQSDIFKTENEHIDKLKQEHSQLERKILKCINLKDRINDSIYLINSILKPENSKEEVEFAPERDESGQIIERKNEQTEKSNDTLLYRKLLSNLEKRLTLINTDTMFLRLEYLKKKIADIEQYEQKTITIANEVVNSNNVNKEVTFSDVCIIGGIFSFLILAFIGIYPVYLTQSFALWINGIADMRKRQVLKALFIFAYACHYILIGIWLMLILASISSDKKKKS